MPEFEGPTHYRKGEVPEEFPGAEQRDLTYSSEIIDEDMDVEPTSAVDEIEDERQAA